MVEYQVIVEGSNMVFEHAFDGEPQVNLTFTSADGKVYRVASRAHDEEAKRPTIHAQAM